MFMTSFVVIFVLSGIGNGSTYKMIPSVLGWAGPGRASGDVLARRMVAAVVGIAGAIGALGGVLVQVVIRNASLHVSALETAAKSPGQKAAIALAHSTWMAPALWTFVGSYAVLAAVTYLVYVRAWSRRTAQLAVVVPA
jgi:NNP family nitrate/nitrite transporter-like MFS transporter